MGRRLLEGRRIHGPESARIWIDERPLVNFVGCSYLAIQSSAELHRAAERALAQRLEWSQMLSCVYGGGDPFFDEVGKEGADFFGTETSVFLPTGYFCGLAAVSGLAGSFDAVLIDELAHFNLRDAAQLSQVHVHVFRHCDADSVRELVRRECAQRRPLLLTDGVFATSGRVPPLADYAEALATCGGQMMVDESHAYGVLGDSGRGALEHCGVSGAVHAGTLGKGFCAQGALLPCSSEMAKTVRAKPPLRGAGSGSPVSALVSAAALRVAREQPERRQHLHRISQRLKRGLRGLGLTIVDTPASITSFEVGTRSRMEALQRSLFDEGLHVVISDDIGAGPEGTPSGVQPLLITPRPTSILWSMPCVRSSSDGDVGLAPESHSDHAGLRTLTCAH